MHLVYPSVLGALVVTSWLVVPWLGTLVQVFGALWLLSQVARWITEELIALRGAQHVDPRGKAVLITGCDSGFGLELAVRLHNRGLRVFAGCLMPDSQGANRLRALSSEVGEGKGSVHVLAPMDVTSDSQVEDAVQQVTKILAKEGHFAIPFSVGYCMSKCAARFFTDGLRREMKKFGLRVVSVEPNMYATNLTSDSFLLPAMDKQWQESSDQVRRDYGQAYYELSRQWLRRGLAKESRTEVHEVVDAMEAAVLARKPRIAYRPDGFFRAIEWSLLGLAPPAMQDAILVKRVLPPATTIPGARGIARG